MPASNNTVEEAATLLRQRIAELDEERKSLETALASLTGGRVGRRGPGRPRGSSKPASGGAPRRRRRRGGTRRDQAAKLVAEKPGISASDIAKELKIQPNYMYRVMADLVKDGTVKKKGREYHPAG